MKTVIHVADSASRLGGGMFESICGLCKGLTATGKWMASVVALEDSYSESDRPVWKRAPHLVPPSQFGPISSARRIAEVIRSESPSIVHLHGIWGPASIAVRSVLSASQGPPVIVSPHGMLEPWALQRSRLKKSIAWFGWTRAVVNRATLVHALCDEEATSIRAIVKRGPIAVVPNGVSLPEVSGGSGNVQRRDVLFLGRIHPKKGIPSLIEAWPSVAATKGWRLIIAGWDDGGHEQELKALAMRLGLGDRVIFKGPVFGQEKEDLFRSAAAFILPSLSEGLPMAILEAWSYGLPVLMTDECHLAEGFAANAAIRIDPTPESISSGLSRLLENMSDAERGAMGARGRALAETRFSWKRIGAEMSRIYDQATASGGNRVDDLKPRFAT